MTSCLKQVSTFSVYTEPHQNVLFDIKNMSIQRALSTTALHDKQAIKLVTKYRYHSLASMNSFEFKEA